MIRPTRVRRLRIRRTAQVATIVAGALLLGWVVTLASRKDVTLIVAGRPVAVQTTSGSVRDLIASTGLPSDVRVEPPPATALADGMTVVVSPPPGVPASALATMVDPHGVGVWVVERSGSTSFGKATSEPVEVMASADAVGPTSSVSVRAVVSGKVHHVATNASTVGALLSAMGITPDADDRVVPSPTTPLLDGSSIRYDRVDVVERERTVRVAPLVETVYSSSLLPGQTRVVARGADGVARDHVRVTLVNGVETSRIVARRVVVAPPMVERVVSGPMSMFGGSLTEPGTGAVTQTGGATWYDPPWSGLTAAHPWLPFGTQVTVTDLASGRSVTVVIDDRGPFSPGRIIDLSPEAFSQLAPLGRGVLRVRLDW